MRFDSFPHAVDEAPILVMRGERSRMRPLPRQLKLYGITSGISFVVLVVFAVVQGIVTSDRLRLWAMGVGFIVVLGLGAYSIIRRRGRIEVTPTQLRLVDGFGRARLVPISEVSSLVRGTIEVGRQMPMFAVLVIDKAGRVRLRFGHIDVERLADAIGVPVIGRFEDRIAYP